MINFPDPTVPDDDCLFLYEAVGGVTDCATQFQDKYCSNHGPHFHDAARTELYGKKL